ncbi:tyrosine-protein phosphatase [Clostridium sp. HBUAS56010]|uniref:tyrosine-protein phosphatase n=1 Tax=Clostridium sp. HBUAS56010 TaxID=2571127 RepID=UPI001178345A|nr:tyrosine-protein phosphatase [Clostridium sp. HBUAS56010]
MDIIQKAAMPISLERAYNVRDLGTYRNKDNKKLNMGRLLRADSLHELNEEDIKKLLDYGVTCVIDLRSPEEYERAPSWFAACNEVAYYSVSLYDQIHSNDLQGGFPDSLHELYINWLENSRQQISRILNIIGENGKGCTLFHCTAGKDRTGLIAMLILSLADVEEEVIVIDYEVSGRNMEPVFRKMRVRMQQEGVILPEYLFKSEAGEMQYTLAYLKNTYGSVVDYLHTLDISEEVLDAIKYQMMSRGKK